MVKEYEIKANLGDTKDGTEYSNQWHSLGKFTSREIAERTLSGVAQRPDCKAAVIVVRQSDESDQTCGAEATRPPSGALAMLAARNQEIAAHEAGFTLGTSAGKFTGPAADALLHKAWTVVGNPEVQVRLELRSDLSNQRHLVIALIDSAEETQKYRSVEVGFRAGQIRQSPLQLGWTSLLLDANEIEEIESLVIVDVDGNRYAVSQSSSY